MPRSSGQIDDVDQTERERARARVIEQAWAPIGWKWHHIELYYS